MNGIGAQPLTQPGDRRALAPIRPARYHDPMGVHAGLDQWSKERCSIRRIRDDRGDVHFMTQALQPCP